MECGSHAVKAMRENFFACASRELRITFVVLVDVQHTLLSL
jgi:hypothetical protein